MRRLELAWQYTRTGAIAEAEKICREITNTKAAPEFWDAQHQLGVILEMTGTEPHKLDRTVKTASHWQVRQPIYKTSVERWRNYENYLSPLKEALGYQEES